MNRKRNLGRLASLAVAILAVLVVAACGGGFSVVGGGVPGGTLVEEGLPGEIVDGAKDPRTGRFLEAVM